MAGIGHVAGAGISLSVRAGDRVHFVKLDFRQLFHRGFIIVQEHALDLLDLEVIIVGAADGARERGFVGVAQDVDEVEVVLMHSRGAVHIHAQVDLQENLILVVDRETNRVHAAAGVAHRDDMVGIDEIEKFDGVPDGVQAALAVTGETGVVFRVAGRDV